LAESTYGDVLEEMQRTIKMAAGESRPMTLLLDGRRTVTSSSSSGTVTGTGAGAGAGVGVEDFITTTKPKNDPHARMPRPAGLSMAAIDLTGAGIINLEGLKAERPSKVRLAVGDEEVRLAFRDDPEIKALGVIL